MVSPLFFWSWPTWAKLSFVLGGSLVIVLSLAGIVKIRKIWKLKNFAKVHSADVERAEVRVRARSSDEIPFGAKAMMEDPDVEGVWNSRASTPLQSPVLQPRNLSPSRLSLNRFSRSRRNSSVSSLSRLNLPESAPSQPRKDNTQLPSPTTNNAGTSTSAAAPLNRSSQDTPWQYQVPMPYAQDGSMPRRRSVTIRAVSKQDLAAAGSVGREGQTPPIPLHPQRRARVSTDPTPATPTRGRTLVVYGPSAEPVPERTPTTMKALDRMEAHRRFHAAESGSLQPRLKHDGSRNLGHKHNASDNFVMGQENTRAVSWPITPGEILVDFTAPQKVQTKNSPHVVPFRAFVEMHPPPKAPVKAPPSAWTDKTQGMLEEKLEAQVPKKRITIKNDNLGRNAKEFYVDRNLEKPRVEEEATSLLGNQQRIVNEGFEVLPAGFFEESDPVKDAGYSKEALREASNETRKPRKLQKRSRSGSREGRSSLETVRHIQV